MANYIKASWLHTQTFCEYQLYLSECRGIHDVPSPDLKAGKAAHAELDAGLDPNSVHIDSIVDAICQAQAKSQPFTMREVLVRGHRIIGRIDQLEYYLDRVVIIENKPRTQSGIPFLADRRQVLGYCLALSEQYPELGLPIIAKVHDHTNACMWEHEFDEIDRVDVNDALDRISGIIDGTRVPVPTSKPQKCTNCRYIRYCDKSPIRRS